MVEPPVSSVVPFFHIPKLDRLYLVPGPIWDKLAAVPVVRVPVLDGQIGLRSLFKEIGSHWQAIRT